MDKFVELRTDEPDSTGGHLHDVGRPDIAPLHGTDGSRACTWFDRENRVVWFLGFTAEHDYELFENRAAHGDLLPSEHDEILLELTRQELDFEFRVAPGVRILVQASLDNPMVTQRGTVGSLLRLEVTAESAPIDDNMIADVYICVQLPLPDERGDVPGWPGPDLTEKLARLVGIYGDLEVAPGQVPDGNGGFRPLDWSREIALALRSVEL